MAAGTVPVSTYRLQLTPDFGFAQAGEVGEYLADLGVSHVYLSPVLEAAPGSRHGYDVTDHSRIRAELGGEDEFRSMVKRFRSQGLGIVLDIVPNHMAIPVPETLNRQLWSVLRDGRGSPSGPPSRSTVRSSRQSATGPPRIGSSIRSSCAAQSMSNQFAYGEPRPSRSTDQSWRLSVSGTGMAM